MIETTAIVVATIKTAGSIAAYCTAYIKFVESERAKQFALVQELGTLAEEIKNAEITGKEYAHLQARRAYLLSLTVKTKEDR